MKTFFFALLAASTLLIGSAQAGGPLSSEDRLAINRVVTAIAAGADRHDWDRVRGAFAQTVTTDYTSLFGGEPVTQPADALVEQWSKFLPGFEATQHLVTNISIDKISPDKARAEADFQATHRIESDLWVLGGRYQYELTRFGVGWRVTSLTMIALWETGDRAGLIARAGKRAEKQ